MAPRVFLVSFLLSLSAGCLVPAASPNCNVAIDWVNFIQVGKTQYVAGPEAGPVLQESELGPIYAHVKFKVSGKVCDPGYRPKDGDAAFLEPGTSIYQVTGHPAAEELAARFNGQILIYRPVKPVS